MKLELELVQIKFISGNRESFWVAKGMESALDRIQLIPAFAVAYEPDMSENNVNISRKYTIRMESIEYIEYKDKFNTLEV
jgi:hypothetical protein